MGTIDLNLLPIFVAVADASSFSAAARKLGMPKSTVSRAVSALEASTGVRLLQRTTRHVSLSTAGRRFYDRMAPQLGLLRSTLGDVPSEDQAPSGNLRLTATVDFGAAVLADIVARFVLRYPAVSIDLRLTNDVVDLVAEGIDMAFRTSTRKLQDSSMSARRAMPLHIQLYASATYLARKGTPRTPADLEAHEHVIFRSVPARIRLESGGESARFQPRGRVTCDDMWFAREAAQRGVGIALLPTFLTGDDLASGRLVRVLPKWKLKSGDLWLVMPSARHMPRALVAFRAFVLDALRS